MDIPEEDDILHNPDPQRDRKNDQRGSILTPRGFANLGCLFLLITVILLLFAGYPISTHFLRPKMTNQGGFGLGGINATGQIADIPGNFGLIDRDTPQEAYTKTSYTDPNDELVLVFSDEFNEDGRTFYPGDDPYWEAVDLHYWATQNLEWYDPSHATTQGGALKIVVDKANPDDNHGLSYRSAMLQTWNKFCFTGGILEASVTLPGSSNISGFWPAVWTMGNLGRAGFGGSLEGMWPYSYDSCDVGTVANQTDPNDPNSPEAALTGGDPEFDGVLSFLPGQRLSACTCDGESHPGPKHQDGTYVGRAAPEIDVFEAIVTDGLGDASMSVQTAPFNARYKIPNDTSSAIFYDDAHLNSFKGGVYQQTVSGLQKTNQDCYELNLGCYSIYAFEYKPGFDDGYVTWVNDNKVSWTLFASALGGDTETNIQGRPISQEPMYIIVNLGISHSFGDIDFENLIFPATMSIDYIRVYQPKEFINVGCDPENFPTATYIEAYKEVYTNPNITTWEQAGQVWPKNRLVDAVNPPLWSGL
ncbi:glycoside hydrolase family 16 protein [Cyathus striatus]|nr:glycoside hydrolase family 16 protein [Cyathus striatus]